MPRPKVFPVLQDDLDDFCSFLNENFRNGWSLDEWKAGFSQLWCPGQPNHGCVLKDDGGRIVGAIGAIYAERSIRGKEEKFCNITSWYVLEDYKSHSMRLAIALTSQPGFHYTDFTPTNTVTKSLLFLKFQAIDARQIWLPNLPIPNLSRTKARVVDQPEAMLAELDEERARVMKDHLHLPWLDQVVVTGSGGALLVMFKPIPIDGKPGAIVLGVSSRDLFTNYLAAFQRYLRSRKRIQRVRFEQRFVTKTPRLAFAVRNAPRKLFLSESLGEADIDNLYSELTALDMRPELL